MGSGARSRVRTPARCHRTAHQERVEETGAGKTCARLLGAGTDLPYRYRQVFPGPPQRHHRAVTTAGSLTSNDAGPHAARDTGATCGDRLALVRRHRFTLQTFGGPGADGIACSGYTHPRPPARMAMSVSAPESSTETFDANKVRKECGYRRSGDANIRTSAIITATLILGNTRTGAHRRLQIGTHIAPNSNDTDTRQDPAAILANDDPSCGNILTAPRKSIHGRRRLVEKKIRKLPGESWR